MPYYCAVGSIEGQYRERVLKVINNHEFQYFSKEPASRSIAVARYRHLHQLDRMNHGIVISLRDPMNNTWTRRESLWKFSFEELMYAYDIHRSIIYNEIIV